MAYEHRNVLVGAADIFVSTEDSSTWTTPTALPARVGTESFRETMADLADAADPDWRHVGYTQGGVEVTVAPDYTGVESDQTLDDVVLVKSRQTVTITTTLLEATLENLLFAFGQDVSTLETTGGEDVLDISAGALGDYPIERAVVLVGNAPRATNARAERVWYLDRVLAVESTSIGHTRAEATTIPVSLRALPGSAFGGRYGRIFDRTWTPGSPGSP